MTTTTGRARRLWSSILKHSLNRVTARAAKGSHGPFSLVRHVGRSSGKQFETPIIVQPMDGGFAIALTYGPNVNWYRNVVAADGCVLVRHGVSYVIDRLEPLSAEDGTAAFPQPQRTVLRLLGEKNFVRFLIEGSGKWVAQPR